MAYSHAPSQEMHANTSAREQQSDKTLAAIELLVDAYTAITLDELMEPTAVIRLLDDAHAAIELEPVAVGRCAR